MKNNKWHYLRLNMSTWRNITFWAINQVMRGLLWKSCVGFVEIQQRCNISSRRGSTWTWLNNIPHVVSSPKASSDTNKSFRMFYLLLHAAHQTALCWKEGCLCVSLRLSVEEGWLVSNYLMLLLFLNKLLHCAFSSHTMFLLCSSLICCSSPHLE